MQSNAEELRKQFSLLKDELLIEILNVSSTEYTDEALQIANDELKSRGIYNAEIDKEKEDLTFRDILFQVKLDNVKRILIRDFNIGKENVEDYENVFYQLLYLSSSEPNNIHININKQSDELGNICNEWGVTGIDSDSTEKFSLELYNWSDWLNFMVDTENIHLLGKDFFIACCLKEMTIHGFKSEEIDKKYLEISSTSYDATFEAFQSDPEEIDTDQVRPWVRYWARLIDIGIISIILRLITSFMPKTAIYVIARIDYFVSISLFILIMVESALLSTWGTTPGKYLLGVIVTDKDNKKLSYGCALNRSALVWIYGMGCGIDIINLITNIVSYDKLISKGITKWDEKGKYSVTHKKISNINVAIAIIIIVGIPVLNYFNII